jgi:hypothetical protein
LKGKAPEHAIIIMHAILEFKQHKWKEHDGIGINATKPVKCEQARELAS